MSYLAKVLASAWPPTMTSQEIVDYITSLKPGHKMDDFLVQEILNDYKDFKLTTVKLDMISHDYKVDESKIVDYSLRKKEDQPPIVLAQTSLDLILIDGAHRFEAALERGDEDILAYVGEEV